jgi:RNA polymerase sigma-70 factor, ECF subfamily
MQTPTTFSITLQAWRQGDADAGDRLLRSVYEELHRLAQHYLQREQYAHSISPTVLIHEVYLRLFGHEDIAFENRSHFFVIAAGQMRRILVDRARRATAHKRIRAGDLTPLIEAEPLLTGFDFDLLALDEALTRLAAFDPRACQVVELRFFGGFEDAEAAQMLGISTATLRRDWNAARLWLFHELQGLNARKNAPLP